MFPSRPWGLPPCARLWFSTMPADSEFEGEFTGSPARSLSVLYPTGNLQPGWTGVPLRREPAITGLDWSFAPIPRSEKRIARQNSCRPPPEFPPASPCPGIDRPASGLTLVTSGLFRPCSWSRKRLRAYWFPCAFGVWKLLKLATKINSPVRVSRRKVQPRSSPLVLTGCPEFL